jgi:hypothetical protein
LGFEDAGELAVKVDNPSFVVSGHDVEHGVTLSEQASGFEPSVGADMFTLGF